MTLYLKIFIFHLILDKQDRIIIHPVYIYRKTFDYYQHVMIWCPMHKYQVITHVIS